MKNLTLILNFVLFVLFIGQIQSQDKGETVYNENVVILDSLSDWRFRQGKDEPINLDSDSATSDKPKYFLISDRNNLNFVFKDNVNLHNKLRFKNLDQCNKVDITYSFDYYLDFNVKLKNIKWDLNLLKQSQAITGKLKEWTTVSNKASISIEDLKSKYANDKVFEMKFQTLDKHKNSKLKGLSTSRFAIRNLELVYSCVGKDKNFENKLEFELQPEKNAVNPFTLVRDGVLQNNSQLIDYWSNLIYPQFVENEIEKYYYSEKAFSRLLFAVTETDFKDEEELCLTFDYFVTNRAFLSVNFMNSNRKNLTLVKLYSTEQNDALIDNESKPEENFKWLNATVCIKGAEILPDKIPQWTIESFVFKPQLKTDVIAVTNFRVKRRLPTAIRNYIPSWKFNGQASLQDWNVIPESSNFKLNVINDQELKLHLKEMPAHSKRHYYVMSDWFIINTSINFLTFKVNSNLTDYHLRLSVLLDPYGSIEYKNWHLNKNYDEQLLQFSFKKVLQYLEKQEESTGKARIIFEIFNSKSLNDDGTEGQIAKGDEDDSEVVDGEQLLTISEIQLADECANEQICNSNGNCRPIEANKATCECKAGFHGDNCEYVNFCTVPSNKLNLTTGDEYCKAKGRNCIPNDDDIVCGCASSEYWDGDDLKCQAINSCLFTTCGLNEQCKLEGSKATCSCNKGYKKDEEDVCIEDLCETNPCKNNMICLHVEGKMSPECICPLGMVNNGRNECVDSRSPDKPYDGVSPFVLQKHGCDQNYTLENNKVVCSCLPGYRRDSTKNACVSTLTHPDITRCDCSDRQICIKETKENEKDKFSCVCKAGYFGDHCENDICEYGRGVVDVCGEGLCSVSSNGKFACNCDKFKYKVNEYGLCELKDECAAQQPECDENAGCVNQIRRKFPFSKPSIVPACYCKRGLGGFKEACKEPCYNKDQCDHIVFSECKRLHWKDDQNRCLCRPGMWRKNDQDDCTTVKSSLIMKTIYTIKNTDQNQKRKVYPTSLELIDSIAADSNFSVPIPKYLNAKTRQSREVDVYDATQDHSPIETISYPCHGSLDMEACVAQWNKAFKQINKLAPSLALSGPHLESILRNSLLESFNQLFDKQIQSIIVLSFDPLTDLNYKHFGLETFYKTTFLVQSNAVDLTPEVMRETLDKKCIRNTADNDDGRGDMCAVENLGLFTLTDLELKEFDVCEQAVPICNTDRNYCYSNKKEEPDYDFYTNKVRYECRCKPGWKSVGKNDLGPYLTMYNHTCEDIDECADPELNECDQESTTCENLPGSYKCNCDKNFKPDKETPTRCLKLCPEDRCKNGECKIIGDHEDYCQCRTGWTGVNCDEKSKNEEGEESGGDGKPKGDGPNYKTYIVVVIIVSAVILVVTVIALLVYGNRYSARKVDESTAALKRELELVRLDNQRSQARGGASGEIKHISSGNDNPAFEQK